MDTINTCAAAGYDGLLVSHGNQDGSYVFLKELTENYPTSSWCASTPSSTPTASIRRSRA